jgi:hypothetical protein
MQKQFLRSQIDYRKSKDITIWQMIKIRHSPDAAAAALGHGHACLAGAHLAKELVHGLEQGLPSQGCGVHGGGGGHGCSDYSTVCKQADTSE